MILYENLFYLKNQYLPYKYNINILLIIINILLSICFNLYVILLIIINIKML